MRKMTKVAVTLAAMSAMTVASASMAFAAEKQEKGLTGGEWAQQTNGSWKYTKEDGSKAKDQWAQIDGIWYYFKGDTMAQDRFLVLDDKGYFFDGNGRLATGWQKITSKMDAYSDIDIADELYDPTNNYYVQVDDNHEYDYHDFVWCYFDENGVAKHNEWFQDNTGLWYYFDGDVMVKNVYNYRINPDNYDVTDSEKVKLYGFNEDGAMLIGWNYKEVETTWNNPTADDKGKIWYHYKDNGEMQKAGWRQIDGKWYLFANYNADKGKVVNGVGTRDDEWLIGGYPLIVNSYVASYNNSKYEYFYVNGKGELTSNVQKVPKGAYKVLFYTEEGKAALNVAYEKVKTTKDIYVNFGEKNYAAKEAAVDGKFYTMGTENTVAAKFDSNNVWKVNNTLYNADCAFDGYTPSNTTWSFTDNGDAVPSSAADETVGYYVHKKTFETMAVSAYNAAIEADTINASDYIALPVLNTTNPLKDTVEQARATAESAYDTLTDAKSDYSSTKNAWESKSGKVTVAVTGYDPAIVPELDTFVGMYSNLLDQKDAKLAATNSLYKDLQLAKEKDAYASTISSLENAYNTAKSISDEYVKACNAAEGEALYQTRIQYAAEYEAYKDAETALEEATTSYNKASAVVLGYNYKYFANTWDKATTTLPTNFAVKGELVKNAFIGRSDDVLYLADGDGNFVTNKAVVINTDANIVYGDTTYNNAYILFGSDGKAVYGYEGTRKSITIGGVTYWATDKTVSVGKADEVTVFISNKMVDTKGNGVVQK